LDYNYLSSFCYWVLCYILGWVLSGYFVVRFLCQKDIRREGSGNPGALNSGRILGVKGFILTLLGDAGKGAVAVALGFKLGFSQEVVLLGLTAIIAGHIWPLPFKFRGGKGVATFLGGLLIYHPPSLLFLLVVTALGWLVLKEFTAAGLLAVLTWPFFYFLVAKSQMDWGLLGLSVVPAAIIIWAHRRNIRSYYQKYYGKNTAGVGDRNDHNL
jgi:glycerol-3-phosphate acyltransferase PlsY